MNYITTEQYAELKGCSVQYIQKLVKDGKIKALLNETAANHRKEYIIPLSALPEEMLFKYNNLQRAKLGLPPELSPKKTAKTADKKLKTPVSKRIDEFSEDERQQIAFWKKVVTQWQGLRSGSEFKKSEIDSLYISKVKLENPDITISLDILYRKYAALKSNNLEGLVDKRGAWNKGRNSIDKLLLDAFFYFYLDERRLPISRCYELLKTWCAEFYPELVPTIPSERSFRRQAEQLPEAVVKLCRYGDKAFKDTCCPYIERLYEDIEANDVWIADNHTFDFITIGENGRQHRIYLTAFTDAKSGVLVGWNLTENPSSTSTLLALRHAILRFGVPKSVYFDNGSEFLTHDIGGRGHRTKANWNAADIPPTILQMLGIEMHNALVRNAKAKPIERTFGTLKNHISRIIDTFCGGTIIERPESLKWKLKNGVIPEDEQIRKALETLIDGDYNVDSYGGKELRFKGMSRIDVWNSSIERTNFRKASERDLSMLLARTSRYQKIKRNGVAIDFAGEKLWYSGEETIFNIGKEVYVRYDPSDIRTARVYDRDTDKYLWTWTLNNDMTISYITANPADIATTERNRRKSEKAVYEYAKGLTASVQGNQRIDWLAASLLKAENGKKDFHINQPTKFQPVISDAVIEENPQLENIVEVEVDLSKMNKNALIRKES